MNPSHTARPASSPRSSRPVSRIVTFAAFVALSSLVACQRGDLGADAFVALVGPRGGDAPVVETPRPEVDLSRALQEFQRPPFDLPDPADRELRAALRTFYEKRDVQPAWFAEGRPLPEARQLLLVLARLDEVGLDSADYRVPALTQALAGAMRGTGAAGDAEQLELGLTWAALLAASHLHQGRVAADELRSRWQIEREPIDLAAVLATALHDGEIEKTLRGLDPDHPQFAALLQALQRYRHIAAAGGWPLVPKGKVIGEGDSGDAARLRALAQRLHAEGFLTAVPAEYQQAAEVTAAGSLVYSADLADAVRAFQRTRTLQPDGRLGPETQAELAVPVEERLRQIALNVERWRWVPDDFGATTVLVNIPGYTLDVEQDRTIVESMAVVVGGKGWETPVFGDQIEHLVLNPYWNVPPRILAEEVLPRIQSDPSYLATHDMEVVRGESDAAAVADPLMLGVDRGLRVRQRPGPNNPLGQVKFMFPNRHNVYLHDTPSQSTFARADRSASHGCIRVERPVELAELLLRGSSWSPERLRTTIASGQPAHVQLPQKLPVYLLYFTASVRPDGELHFYEDVYGIDAAHRARG